MVDPDPDVSMQEPDGSRECGNAEASYSTGELGGGVELGGRNEAPSAIGGGADLGGGNGGHAAAPKGHRNEVVTMLEADTILNERVCETIVQAQERTISKVLGEMAWKGSQHFKIPLCRLKQSHWVHSAYDLNMAIYTSFTENMSELTFKSLGIDGFLIAAQALWISRTSQANHFSHVAWHIGAPVYTASVFLKLLTGGKKLGMYEPEFQCSTARERELCPWYLELWRQMPLSPFELDLYLECHPEALLEGVEMPKDRDEIHIEQTKDERVENLAENSSAPSHPTAVAHSLDPTAVAHPAPAARNIRRQLHSEDVQENVGETSQHSIRRRTNGFFPSLPTATEDDLQELSSSASHKQVRPLSPTGSVGNMEIVIGDYFQLSNNVSRESSMFHRWMRGLGMNNTFGIDLTFFDLPDGLPPLQGDTPSWNILRPDHISQVVDVASKVLRYEGIMLVILPRSLFWGGLLATMAENDDSRLVEFASGCLLSNIPVETKGASGRIQKVCISLFFIS
ncbi:hypothetical protein SELMODRAFT_416882 [Selaginella moellendorffii]|uniref:Uncharacterized protein n=1 Tax=Selaginella moellendorffii TaxID=88036 RepID=D8S0P7_SELML|nr:hypothetical protein SELMODRAFT_416882 [Selaginella moellendorffii]